jgi:16S rRNA processing protein RimM
MPKSPSPPRGEGRGEGQSQALPLETAPTASRENEKPIVVAAIIGAHGVAGEVRLKVFADDLKAYKRFNDGALTLKSLRHGSNGEIARFAEITDRNAAEAMRGTQITVPRADLPPLEEGEYYHADLLGLAAVSTEGEDLGRVVAIDNYGAGDVLEIERPDGKRFMIPMNADAVPEWDAARMIVDAAFAAQ